ncbi:MAG TPA: transglycosylase SLT domain-containing protein [Candidatus Saccharimonadia bacterium]|nr:transglycosylase SLT domain-containing protein [Candidatus Saccharimonadia bacterium]
MKVAVRLAACIALTALAGCTTMPRVEPAAGPAPAQARAALPERAPASSPALPDALVGPPELSVVPSPEVVSDWARIRAGFEFARCERDRVRAAMRALLRSPQQNSAMLARAMPLLLFVRDELERRGLPLEFVFLPMIESAYVAVPSVGNRPAGLWQIMPVTAKGLGLEREPGYDARLDAARSTRAAVSHLSVLADRFEQDWRLVTMAYNAGEFRVRRAMRDARLAPNAIDHERLALSPITHTHLARLEAWACIVSDAERNDMRLPEIGPGERLVEVLVETPLDFALAAALARASPDRFHRDNPAHRDGTVAANRTLLVPARERERYQRLLARIPAARRLAWTTSTRAAALAAARARGELEPGLLAEMNEGAPIDAWLAPSVKSPSSHGIASTSARPALHMVRSGESLWLIARRHGFSVDALRTWNGLARGAILRPGDTLRLSAPRASPRP